jgi:hypothetical protein
VNDDTKPRYIIRDAETGYAPPGIPTHRTYATEAAARRAAQRAADGTGRDIEYGTPKFFGGGVIKFSSGICVPREVAQ